MNNQRNLWIPLLIAAVIGAGLLGSMYFPPYMVWAGIMMALFGAILLGHPRHLLFVVWLWASFLPLISQAWNNLAIRYTEELLAVAVIGICGASYVWRLSNRRGIGGISKIFIALIGVMAASAVINRSPIANTVNFFLGYLSFIFVFYVAYTTLDRRHWRYLVGGIIGLMLIQFVLNIGWRLGVNPLPNIFSYSYSPVDMAQGTFASCARVAYFMVAVIFTLFSALRLDKKYRPWIAILLFIAGLQLYMTYTNHAFMYFIFLLPIYLIISKQSMQVRLACVALVILGVLGFSFLAARDVSTDFTTGSVDVQFDRQNLEDRWERFVHGPKIELINRITVENAARAPFLWLMGNGPGYGLSAVGMERGSDFAWEYLGAFVANTASYRAGDMTSITGSFYSGILTMWSELGAVGYLLYISLYVYAIRRVVLTLFRNQYVEPLQRVLAEGFVMAMLTLLLSSILIDTFFAKYYTVSLWIWAAMVWTPAEKSQRSEDGDQPSEVGNPPEALAAPAPSRWARSPSRR